MAPRRLVAHAFTKAGLFVAAGAWLSMLGTKQLDKLHGVARRWPLVGWCATVAAVALAGVAPLSLWATKDAVLAVALDHSIALYAVGLVAVALSAAYAAKILVAVWGAAAPVGEPKSPKPKALNAFVQPPILVLAAGAAVAGVLALPPIAPTMSRVLDHGSTAHATAPELAASAALALLVVVTVMRWGSQSRDGPPTGLACNGPPMPRSPAPPCGWLMRWPGSTTAFSTGP